MSEELDVAVSVCPDCPDLVRQRHCRCVDALAIVVLEAVADTRLVLAVVFGKPERGFVHVVHVGVEAMDPDAGRPTVAGRVCTQCFEPGLDLR